MSGFRLRLKRLCAWEMFAVPALTLVLSSAALGGSNITGTVRNGSRDQPAAGDEVTLLRTDNGMTEARVKTDDRGAFTLAVEAPNKRYLVRVTHEQISYDQRATAGDALSILVFDAAPQVQGISGSIEILRAGTTGKLLHVSDLYEVKNESSPALTQAGEHTFEVYLPANTRIASVLAAGPDGIGVMIEAVTVPGEAGHYAVNFPLRPGATKFAFNYDLPYDGRAVFRTRHAYSVQQLAVMIPPAMSFWSRAKAFEVLTTGNNHYQVRAANQVKAGEGPAFEISGEGALPPLGDQAQTQAREPSLTPSAPTVAAPARVASASLSNFDPRLKQTPPPSQAVVMEGVTAVLFAACAFLVWRARKTGRISRARQ